jgi:hypothetical protein
LPLPFLQDHYRATEGPPPQADVAAVRVARGFCGLVQCSKLGLKPDESGTIGVRQLSQREAPADTGPQRKETSDLQFR